MVFDDMMIHDFDMARFLAGGAEVTEVVAAGSVLIDPAIGEADVDTAVVMLSLTMA